MFSQKILLPKYKFVQFMYLFTTAGWNLCNTSCIRYFYYGDVSWCLKLEKPNGYQIHGGKGFPRSSVGNLPAKQETWDQSPRREDPLKKEIATHSSVLAWRIPWTEEPGGLQSMGSQESVTSWWLNPPTTTGKRKSFSSWEIRKHLLIFSSHSW